MKQLIEQIRDDWKLLIGKSEIDIIKRYIGYVRFITVNAIGKNKTSFHILIHRIRIVAP